MATPETTDKSVGGSRKTCMEQQWVSYIQGSPQDYFNDHIFTHRVPHTCASHAHIIPNKALRCKNYL